MRRLFGWALVGGLVLAVASTASAQFSVTFGSPYAGRGVGFGGYGGYGVTPGYTYGTPAYAYGSPAYYAPGYGPGYPATYGGYGVTPGYAYGTPAYGSGTGYGPASASALIPGYSSGYAGDSYPGTITSIYRAYPSTTTTIYRGYSGGYGPAYGGPTYGTVFSGYGDRSYGVGRGTYLIRIR